MLHFVQIYLTPQAQGQSLMFGRTLTRVPSVKLNSLSDQRPAFCYPKLLGAWSFTAERLQAPWELGTRVVGCWISSLN